MRRSVFAAAVLLALAGSSQRSAAMANCEMMFEPMAGDVCMYKGRVCVITRDASVQEYFHVRCKRSKTSRKRRRGRKLRSRPQRAR